MTASNVTGQHSTSLEKRVSEIFSRNCTQSGCHSGPNPQMGMALTEDLFYASTVGETSTEKPAMKRIDPGHPERSYLIHKIRGDDDIIGVQMPFTGEKLTEEEVDAIVEWVAGLGEADKARKEDATENQPVYPFDGWKIVNLPTALTVDHGNWLFLIGHRFNPKISDGFDALYGLDGSGIIYLSMGYSVNDDLLLALARSNSADNVELQARYRIARQQSQTPLGIAAQVAVNWVSEDPGTDESRLRGDALKLTGQVALTRAIGRASVAVVPGITLNPAEHVSGEDPLLTIGLGGRWTFTQLARTRFSVVGEWVPIVSGYTRTTTFGNDIRFDSWGGGVEISIGGHVFQVIVSNSVGLTSDQYLRGGDLDISEGDMRLGFNIFRVLNF
jgi:hypothetical protein